MRYTSSQKRAFAFPKSSEFTRNSMQDTLNIVFESGSESLKGLIFYCNCMKHMDAWKKEFRNVDLT